MLRHLKIWCLTIALTIGATAWTDAVGNTSSEWDVVTYKYGGSTLIYNILDEINVEIASAIDVGKNGRIYIPSEIQRNDTTYYVLGVGDNAFSGNTNIKQVDFEENIALQYIGEGAFSGCSNLKEIELPSSITEIAPYTFAMCGLEYIEIHDFITKIGERAFTNCTLLSEIYMGENIEEIGDYAFGGCNALTSFTIPEKVKHLGYEILQANKQLDTLYYNAIDCKTSGAYYDERIERTVGAFENNKGLSEVIFGESVERIPEYLLYNCQSIDSLYFSKSIKEVDRFALHNTGWFDNITDDMVYVNNILYNYKGKATSLSDTLFKESMTTIASHCFYNNKMLQNIKLPSSVLTIGVSAFENCVNLNSIILPYDLERLDARAFKGCKNLKSVQFNHSLKKIGEYCFSGCHELTSAQLSHTIKEMGEGVFYNCNSLREANIPDSTKSVVAGCFSKCPNLERIKIHRHVTHIEEYAFAGCSRLDSVIIPRECEVIGSRAFSHCDDLTYIDIHTKSVRIDPLAFYKCNNLYYIDLTGANRIGKKAFADCKQLRNIRFGKELTYISDYAFENCRSLRSVEIPQNVTYIGRNAFSKCRNITSLEIKDAATTIGPYAFSRCEFLTTANLGSKIIEIGSNAFNGCESLRKIEIINPIEEIKEKCFKNCSSLESIKLPDGLKVISEEAFAGCESATEIIIPNTITKIDDYAFSRCQSIEEINLPKEISTIGEKAFWQCQNLKKIEIPETLEKLGAEAFGGCPNLTLITFNAERCQTRKPAFSRTLTPAKLTIGKAVQTIGKEIFAGMNIEVIEIPQNVAEIKSHAFANSENLKEVVLHPNNNIEIDNSAFNGTKWHKNQNEKIIYINQVAFKYIGNDKPTELTFREGTTSIAANFMKDNDALTKISLPNSIEIIGSHAFDGCTNLSNVEFPPYITNINEYAFANCRQLTHISLSTYLTEIGNFAFENCTSLDSIHILQAYCSIGMGAFRNCSRMTKAILGDNITSIGSMAFAYCTNLQSINDDKHIVLPSKIKLIDEATFYNCERLKGRLTIPRDVTTIRDRAFEGCRNINSVEISAKLDSLSASAFERTYNFSRFLKADNKYFNIHNGLLCSKDLSVLYYCPQGYTGTCIPHNTTQKVAVKAFDNCTKLQYIILNHVKEIDDYAFNGCSNLRRVAIGKNTIYIGNRIFEGCPSLSQISVRKDNALYKSVDGVLYTFDMKTLLYCPRAKTGVFKIPKSVEHIADYAFYNCSQITRVIMHKNIKTIGKEAFTGCKTQ